MKTRARHLTFTCLVISILHTVLQQFLLVRRSEQSLSEDEGFELYNSEDEGFELYNSAHVFGNTQKEESVGNEKVLIKTEDMNRPPPSHTWLLRKSDYIVQNHKEPGKSEKSSPTVTIPRIINKLYFSKSGGFEKRESMPIELKEAHQSWQTMNPGYDIRYFDLISARKYLKNYFHEIFLRTFDCLEAFAYKANFFRLVLLYREGGWHSDWKQSCLKENLLDDISNEVDFFSAYDHGNPFSRKDSCVQNAFLGSPPQHPIIEKALKMQFMYVQTNFYSKKTSLFFGVCLLGQTIKAYEKAQRARDAAKHAIGIPQMKEKDNGLEAVIFYEDFEEMPNFSGVAGDYSGMAKGGYFIWKNEKIVQHKCKNCGTGQDWKGGNNYNVLWRKKMSYCQDSKSLFHTTY